MNEGNSNPEEVQPYDVDASAQVNDVAAPAAPVTPAANEGELDKIQELLFGNHLRAINQKIMLVHKDFKQSISELERKLEAQIQAETSGIKNHYEHSSVQMLSSSNDAHDKISLIELGQAEAQASVEQRMSQLVTDIDQKLQAMRTDFQTQLEGSTKKKGENDKVYRAALSDLLGGIAEKVNALDSLEATIGADDDKLVKNDEIPTVSEADMIPTLKPAKKS